MFEIKKTFTALISLVILIISCSDKNERKYPSPPGYDLNKPYLIKLRSELNEISGMVFYAKDTSIFAINDENGNLYKVYIRDKPVLEKWRFNGNADYEDMALIDSTFYVLKSNGDLFSFKVTAESIISDEMKMRAGGKNNFESLYYDQPSGNLVMICKECSNDDKNSVTGWAYNVSSKAFVDTPFFVLDAGEIGKFLNPHKGKFRPSAAVIHPLSKDLYILSSVNKALIIADREGKLKQVIQLNPAIFKQPEGITFSPDGDLFISNESAGTGPANVLLFKYKISS